jgi:putative heme-binding domain-containing protein
MLRLLLANGNQSKPHGAILGALLTSTSIARDSAAVAQALELIARPRASGFETWQFRAMAGLLDGLERQGTDLKKFVRSATGNSADVEPMFHAARQLAGNSETAALERIGAIELLGHGASANANDLQLLGDALSPQSSVALQEASLEALKKSRAGSAADVLLAKWRGFSPNLRMKTMNALGSRGEWVNRLLGAIEAGRISAGEVSPGLQQRLVTSSDASIRSRSEKLFSSTRSDRQTLVRQYVAAVTGSGDSAHGAALFRQNCVACHKLHGEGTEIGPDLGTVTGKPTEVLLTAILDPNQAVESRYLSYNITTKNGRELSGIITGETTTSITVRNQGGTEEVLLRSDISEFTSSGLSLMPEGLEKALKPADMADLIAWLRAK